MNNDFKLIVKQVKYMIKKLEAICSSKNIILFNAIYMFAQIWYYLYINRDWKKVEHGIGVKSDEL